MIKALYERHVLPRIVSATCGSRGLRRARRKVVPEAEGVVLDVGFGSGHNLGLLRPERVQTVYALEPSAAMLARATRRCESSPLAVELVPTGAEAIPLAADSVDTALLTFTACTIPDVATALQEIRRVLRPSGRLLFVEHGLSPDPEVARWQNRLTGAWRVFSGGCHLNRDFPALLLEAGFQTERLEMKYGHGPRWAAHLFIGSARP